MKGLEGFKKEESDGGEDQSFNSPERIFETYKM